MQLYLPSNGTEFNRVSDEYIDSSWHLIRCDLREILIDPYHHANRDRFVSRIENHVLISSKDFNSLYRLNHCRQLNIVYHRFLCRFIS